MKKILTTCLALVLTLVVPAMAQVQIGAPAKEFTLTDVSGQSHSLSDFKGKYVVLEWFNYDCPFVKKHYSVNNMQSLQKEFTDKGVIWLSINSSAPGNQGYYKGPDMAALAEERGAASTGILLDPDGAVGRSYGAKTTPHMFIVDPDGVLIYQGAIDDKSGMDSAEVAGAYNYVSAALNEAMAGQPVSQPFTQSYGCSVKY